MPGRCSYVSFSRICVLYNQKGKFIPPRYLDHFEVFKIKIEMPAHSSSHYGAFVNHLTKYSLITTGTSALCITQHGPLWVLEVFCRAEFDLCLMALIVSWTSLRFSGWMKRAARSLLKNKDSLNRTRRLPSVFATLKSPLQTSGRPIETYNAFFACLPSFGASYHGATHQLRLFSAPALSTNVGLPWLANICQHAYVRGLRGVSPTLN